ncbi:hypothetical protein [Streptomyces halobius]|uniref:Uncharacterized protein n=1 Tax=Streptomyces halobius TaxID=2879846 RepID=A0ABY4M6X3_9ACTN|nr:hypothetical protein [Streptomyces halobius]UQA93516.1 hypothetical protein K9S39_18150 [Streptomyces halobius]
MSAVFAMPATLRLPRTVAVRRVLLAGLFLVGFAALGFAFGTGAHAEDRTGSTALTGASASDTTPETASAEAAAPDETNLPDRAATQDGATDPSADRLSDSGAEFAQQREAARAEIVEREQSASTTLSGVLWPAADHLRPVTEPVTGAVEGIREVAGATLPGGLPSGEHAEQPGNGNGGTPEHGDAPNGAPQAGAQPAANVECTSPAPSSRLTDGLGTSAAEPFRPVAHEQRDQGHDGLPDQSPQGPVAPASHSAGDGHGPRGGDQFAASLADPTRFRLLPGGVRTADGAPTRRRAEEILEFPG